MAAPCTRPFIGINADLVTPAKGAPITRLAVGYADETAPINAWRSPREPLDAFASFDGFES